MKKSITSLLLLAGLYATAQVKVGDNPNTINASAVLEMESTNKGLLPPRMTTGQRDAISNPAKGLAIFNTTSNSLEVNTGTPASPVWSSAKSGDVNNTTLTSSTSPAGTSLGQMMYNTGAVQPTGLVYWDGTQWKSVASSGGDTTNNYPVTNNSAVTNNSTVTNNNPVTNNSTSTFNGVSTFNDQAVFNDTAVFNNGMKVGNLPQGAITDSLMVFEPNTKEVRRLSIAGAASAGEPWYKVGTTSGATANTDDVYLNGKVGVGTNTPIAPLHISTTGANGVAIERDAAANSSARLALYKKNGGSAVTNGSAIGAVEFYAHNGTGYPATGQPSASIATVATEDHTTTAAGAALAFRSALNGYATALERMRIDNNGNVGIGTSTPVAKLHIAGDATTFQYYPNSSIFSTNTGTGGHTWAFGARAMGTNGDFAISDETDSQVRMAIQGGTGNVGIGTNNPTAKLEVSSPSDVQVNVATSGASNQASLDFSNNNIKRWRIISTAANNLAFYDEDDSRTPLHLNGTTGNVGIGTTTPATTLHVSSTGTYGVNIERTAAAGAAPRLHFYKNNGTVIGSPAAVTNGSTLGAIDFYAHNGTSYPNVGAANASILSYATEDQTASAKGTNLAFRTNPNGSASSAERMRIDQNGNVGIGTTTPNASALLDITSTDKGFLPPRMTSGQRNAISNPAKGLMIFNTTTNVQETNTGTPETPVWSSAESITASNEPWYKVGTTSAATANTDSVYLNGNVGIGTNSPIAPLHVATTGVSGMAVERAAAAVAPVRFGLYKNNGTAIGSPAAVTNGSVIGQLGFYAHNGTSYPSIASPNASISSNATEDHSGTNGGSNLTFNTVANGATLPAERMRIEHNGNVAINTTFVGAKLNIGGSISSTTASVYDPLVTFAATDGAIGSFYHSYNGSKSYIGLQSFIAGDGEKTPIVFGEWGGNVGIGINTPKAPLHIGGTTTSESFTTGAHSWIAFNSGSVGTSASSGSRTNASFIAEGSIWSKSAIFSAQTMTFSDKRIKNIIGQSDATKDLELLNKIRITDYRMKDVVMQGNKQYKKVIAQEVEALYPEAVTTQTGFVPNIYQLADKVVRLGNNTYKASFKNKVEYNQNVTGDLKLYDEQKEITAKVVSKGDNEIVFTTAEEMKGDKLFLFGEEVTDFRAVDYEALSTLNISATQELYREIQALKKQNAVLTAQVGDTKKLETAYNELAAQVKAMQEVLNMPKVQDGTVAERR